MQNLKQLKFFFSSNNRRFNSLQKNHINFFESFMNTNEIIQTPCDLHKYNIDWTQKYQGNSKLVLKPSDIQSLQKIIQYCNQNKLPIVPQGGNTGLVGSGVPLFDEIIISMEKFNHITKFDENTGIISCQSGCILQDLNNYLHDFGYEIPWDLGAKGSCQIGGNIATNAGGVYLTKYGPIRANVTGLLAVLANGQIFDTSSELRKDNTGFDMKQLLIGSEGMLGIITNCNIVCAKIDKFRQVFFIKTKNYQDVLKILKIAKGNFCKNLAALEFLDSYSFWATIEQMKIRNPFGSLKDLSQYFVLVELGSNHDIDQLLQDFYELLEAEQCFEDIVISENEKQFQDLWNIRELAASAPGRIGPSIFYDFTLNQNYFEDLKLMIIAQMNDMDCYVTSFGHISDGNIHIGVSFKDTQQLELGQKILEPFVFDLIKQIKGSISAEHGIGINKSNYLEYAKQIEVIDLMRQIKKIYDPEGIMNPYKLFP